MKLGAVAGGLGAALALAGLGCGWAQEAAEPQAALVQQAAELAQAGRVEEALPLLQQALAAAPDYPPVHSWLAYAYERAGDKAAALEHLARFAALQPDSDYTAQTADHLFFVGPFPREIPPEALPLSPMPFATETCRTTAPDGSAVEHRIAYTTSWRYPEGTDNGAPILHRPLPGEAVPGAGEARGATDEAAGFNRALYGFAQDPGTGRWRLRCITYYPSDILSVESRDYSVLAGRLTHLLLRFRQYGEGYLGREPEGDPEGLVRLWLCEQRPAGGERLGADIFLYGIGAERPALEWARELAHECGHLLLPTISGFIKPEPTANGELGERLFLNWLARDAALEAGEPWPGTAAVAALDKLWGEPLDVAPYLAEKGRQALALWYQQGPSSELVVGQDEAATSYFVGLALYTEATFGDQALAEVVNTCAGVTVADFLFALKRTMAQRAAAGEVTLAAGAFDPVASHIGAAVNGQVAPPDAVLAPGELASYQVYVTRSQCAVRLVGDGPPGAAATVGVDNGATNEVPLGGEAPVALGAVETGWHRLTVQPAAGCTEPLRLRRIVLQTVPPV